MSKSIHSSVRPKKTIILLDNHGVSRCCQSANPDLGPNPDLGTNWTSEKMSLVPIQTLAYAPWYKSDLGTKSQTLVRNNPDLGPNLDLGPNPNLGLSPDHGANPDLGPNPDLGQKWPVLGKNVRTFAKNVRTLAKNIRTLAKMSGPWSLFFLSFTIYKSRRFLENGN